MKNINDYFTYETTNNDYIIINDGGTLHKLTVYVGITRAYVRYKNTRYYF